MTLAPLSEQSDRDWLAAAKSQAATSFAIASALGDRLALLRELARLSGGRTALPEGVALSEAETNALRRFGLGATDDGGVRILDEDLDHIAPGLSQSLVIDKAERGGVRTAVADAFLLRLTPHRIYRSRTQKAAVQSILTMPDGGSFMVSMPTGAGKSLLFQAPVLWWRQMNPGACAFVIVPTIALAEDHQRTLQAIPGLEASRAISGATPPEERAQILMQFRNGEVPILLMSPEAAFNSARGDLLQAALSSASPQKYGQQGQLTAVFIDEAHIIETWGRSFRPDFQRLPALVAALRANNPALKTVLLSATLTPAARSVLRADYGSGAWAELHAEIPRYQFDLAANGFADQDTRNQALLELIDRAPRPAIVYTTRVDHADDLFQQLTTTRGYARAALFTGALSNADARRVIVEQWAKGDLDLVVATSAFGLGVDKSNVRAVIHACLPEGASRWYQEVGRASRDGHQGLGVTLWVKKPKTPPARRRSNAEEDWFVSDEDDAQSMAGGGWLSRDVAEGRWKALLKGATSEGHDADTGDVRLTLPLDAAREGLDPRYTGERNRGWNRSLLNLLQRQGAIIIEADTPSKEDLPVHWRAIVRRSGLLDPRSKTWSSEWDTIFVGRDREAGQARNELREFTFLLGSQNRECLLIGAYRLIEPDSPVAPCGRCPACRDKGLSPPIGLQPRAADFAWPRHDAWRSELPKGPVLVAPGGDDQTRLLRRLLATGVQQFVASEADTQAIVEDLQTLGADLGFVQAAEPWLRRDGVLPDLPTAFLPPSSGDLGPWLREIRHAASTQPNQTFVLVADPYRRVDNQLLHQVASPHAPYNEASLDNFALAFDGLSA